MKWFIIPILFFFLIGCGSIIPQIIVWDDQNAANSIKTAEQVKKHWDLNSAVLKTSLGATLNTDEYFKLKQSILGLDMATQKPTPLAEKDAGEILGWFGRFVIAATERAVDKITVIVTKLIAEFSR